jgi:GDP-4-dehydro-6-deoxy-D-mannose reductase
MAKRVLVTGSLGFTGSAFCRYMEDANPDWEIVGVDRAAGPGTRSARRMQVTADLCDAAAVADLVASSAPAVIVHLAGLMRSATPAALYETNVLGTLHVLEAAARSPAGMRPRVLVVGSAAEYGVPGTAREFVAEDEPLRPVTHYGASKVAAETVALQYARRGDLEVVAARTFNLVGPGQPQGFLCGDVVSQLQRIARREAVPILQVGNLSPVRDFVDVRDAARGYWLLVQRGVSGEVYNVGSGVGRSAHEVVDTLVRLAGVVVTVRSDEARLRAADAARLVADVGRIRRDVDWRAEIGFLETLRDMLAAAAEAAPRAEGGA